MRSENTTGSPPAQLQKPICRYAVDLECIISPIFHRLVVVDGRHVVFKSDPLFQKAMAVELFEILTPHFQACEFRITETGGITCAPSEFEQLAEDHKSRIMDSRNAEQPGLAYLKASGFAPQNADMPNRGANSEGVQ